MLSFPAPLLTPLYCREAQGHTILPPLLAQAALTAQKTNPSFLLASF